MITGADSPAAAIEQAQISNAITRDFDLLTFLKEEVDKSGELYLKVALWKVLLRLPQHYADVCPDEPEPEYLERMKRILGSTIGHSEQLIREAEEQGGLSSAEHGISEAAVRENIQWLREKLVLLELKLMPQRKQTILSALGA